MTPTTAQTRRTIIRLACVSARLKRLAAWTAKAVHEPDTETQEAAREAAEGQGDHV